MLLNDLTFIANRLDRHAKTDYYNDKELMALVGDSVWKIMEDSYSYLGGYAGADSLNKFIGKSFLWKVISKEGVEHPIALRAYKKERGLKIIASATNRDPQYRKEAKSAYIRLVKEDFKRAWGEHSGKALNFVLKNGGMKYRIPASKVRELLPDKVILPVINEDGTEDEYFYQRKLGNTFHTKMAVGTAR